MLTYKINCANNISSKKLNFNTSSIDDDYIAISASTPHNLSETNTVTLSRLYSNGDIVKDIRAITIPEIIDTNDKTINDNYSLKIKNIKNITTTINFLNEERTNIEVIDNSNVTQVANKDDLNDLPSGTTIGFVESDGKYYKYDNDEWVVITNFDGVEYNDYLILNLNENHFYEYHGEHFDSLKHISSDSSPNELLLINDGDFFIYNSLFLYKKNGNIFELISTKCNILINVFLNDINETINQYRFDDCLIPIDISNNLNYPKEIIVKYETISGKTFENFLEELSNDENRVNVLCSDNRFIDLNDSGDTLNSGTTVLITDSSYEIIIPIQTESDVNLNQKDNIDNQYINKYLTKNINPIINMEKVVFEPAGSSIIKIGTGNTDSIEFKYDTKTYNVDKLDLVDKITLNFHFRDRFTKTMSGYTATNGWKPVKNGFWNGYTYDSATTRLKRINNTFVFNEDQSDLLGYLNFDDDDIKYQKSKIKKSFVRLLFYDSNNPSNQNLLYYSTVYLDSNKLFSKYIKNTNNENNKGFYKNIKSYYIPSISAKTYNNISVNNEYYTTGQTFSFNDDKRLSSRVEIHSRKNRSSSSDGFYLYLFKDNAPKVIPETIYMRVEFNHAGYGQTIPMMMPINGDNTAKILTDSDFPYDGFMETNSSGATRINIEQYYKDLFIEIKIVYDKEKNKYLYFLPRGINNNEMIFNLYEVKL